MIGDQSLAGPKTLPVLLRVQCASLGIGLFSTWIRQVPEESSRILDVLRKALQWFKPVHLFLRVSQGSEPWSDVFSADLLHIIDVPIIGKSTPMSIEMALNHYLSHAAPSSVRDQVVTAVCLEGRYQLSRLDQPLIEGSSLGWPFELRVVVPETSLYRRAKSDHCCHVKESVSKRTLPQFKVRAVGPAEPGLAFGR
jgi:hypothetical protein